MADLPIIPSIGNLDAISDPAVKKALMAIKETLEIREGTRPRTSPLDKFLTARDLLGANVLATDVNGDIFASPTIGNTTITNNVLAPEVVEVIDTSIPGAPLGLIASGTKLAVLLEWDEPANNIAFAEIHRAEVDDIGQAALIGTSTSTLYGDIIGETGLTFYYWIRFISKAGIVGVFNSIVGTAATTGRLGSSDLISVDGAKIIDATILDAKIGTVSADKIRTGALQVGQAIQVGNAQNRIFIDGNGIIRSGGMLDYLNGSGFWEGVTGGVAKWSVGNSSKYMAWDGANLFIQGNNFSLTDSQLVFNGSGTFNGNGKFTGELNVNDNFIVDPLGNAVLKSAKVKGEVLADSGYFGGELLAGVLDFTKLDGVRQVFLSPGIYTITVPTDKTTMRATLVGATGGGGGVRNSGSTAYGGGGGSGAADAVVATFSGLTAGATYTLTIGNAGVGGVFNQNGGDGGNTVLSGLLTATGSKGGKLGVSELVGGVGGAGATSGGEVGSNGQAVYFVAVGIFREARSGSGGAGGKSLSGNSGSRGQRAQSFGFNAMPSENGTNGRALIEFFNPNSVVLYTRFNILLAALQRQGIQIE